MGYTTDFWGEIAIEQPLNEHEVAYLKRFADSRRMHRKKGPYYVGSDEYGDPDVIDYNRPDPSQPGLWCQWVPTDDGTALVWNGMEKFYDSEEWMVYLIDHFLKPGAHAESSGDWQFTEFTFDHTLNGVIDAQGEDPEDRWKLVVENNEVSTKVARLIWGD